MAHGLALGSPTRAAKKEEPINEQTFTLRLRKNKLRQVRRREGRYLLRTNLTQKIRPSSGNTTCN